MIGTVLHDRWRILAELGKGGMGEVWLGEHLEQKRKEAIKILKPQLATDPQFVSRFRREARAVNRLRHPNIIAVYDFGQLADGRFFLSMEYAEGEPVYQTLKREDHFDVPRALHVMGQLAYAVHHAHSRGVVHRDLKPDNLILVGEDELLKVLDFGVAKIVAAEYDESVALSSNNLVWGSPRYMAPERIRGIGNDPRSDVYAMGIMLFELVVGGPPFAGNSNDVIKAHLSAIPDPPSAWRPSLKIPPELDAVVAKAIVKDPAERYQSAADFYAALHKVPGYPQAKPEQRRRFVPAVPKRPATLEPEREPVREEVRDTRIEAPAQSMGNVRGALREVAEALLDLGLTDTRLLTGVANLRDHEQTIASLEAAQDALEHESSALRETMSDRETSLRFALSELEFKATQENRSADVDEAIQLLRGRLASAVASGNKLRDLGENLAGVMVSRAAGLEKLIAAYDELERVVEELLPPHAAEASVRPAADRLALVKRRRA